MRISDWSSDVCSSDLKIGEILAAQIAGQDDQRVAEIHGAALSVCQAAIIKDLQQGVEHVAVRLFHLVEQHDLIRPPPDRFGQDAAFLIAHITRRRADQASDRVRSEEHTSELQSLMRTSYAVFCL